MRKAGALLVTLAVAEAALRPSVVASDAISDEAESDAEER